MESKEIAELMRRLDWNSAMLAGHLGVSDQTVRNWLADKPISGPAKRLMRLWLTEARKRKAVAK